MSDDRCAVKQLDHIIVRTSHPDAFFNLLTETFGLPVAWPLRSYPSFISGGVTLGNLYLEVLSTSAAAPRAPVSEGSRARFAAIAFEAARLDETVAELDSRKVPHGPLVPYMQVEADGTKTRLYANVILGKMLGGNFWIDWLIRMGRMPGAARMSNPGGGGALVRWGLDKVMSGNLVFLVEYGYGDFTDLPHWSEFKSHDEKRAADSERLRAGGGGALGLESASEIVAGVKDLERANESWRKLLAPTQPLATGLWEIADGPAVRLAEGREDAIQALVLKVSDPERAKTFLLEKGMLDLTSSEQIRIDPAKIYGLDIRLV